jgi:hypothetical protein
VVRTFLGFALALSEVVQFHKHNIQNLIAVRRTGAFKSFLEKEWHFASSEGKALVSITV